ncbi:hypothetical protein [Methanobacterium sp. ACI-7]|uniref:hypothetical protein n=1 Tax=unclassified Methanobacterium TaxID=2627676 RepID=UPI0039C3C025
MEKLTLQIDGNIDTTSPRAKGIKKMYAGVDKHVQSKMLDIIENRISEYEKDNVEEKILKKYRWLKEFINWIQDPSSSNKFEYFLK